MKQEYIRQVGRRLRLRRKQKTAVLRDLEEIFASAYEHGETEEQVIQRLGPPTEYAASVEGQLPSKGSCLLWAGLVVCLLVCLVSMGLFALARQLWVPEDAIGFAQGTTGIQVAGGGIGLPPLLLALAGLALVLAVFFLWRLARRKKGER